MPKNKNNYTFRCSVCNSTFNAIDNGSCPMCGASDDYILMNDDDDDNR